MRVLNGKNWRQQAKWYEFFVPDKAAVVHPLEWAFWREVWLKHRWCLEWWGIEHGWFGVTDDGGYFSEGRWAHIGERFQFGMLPPNECKPPWDTMDRSGWKIGLPK